jgi:ADP-heptose:LPS heptosyltransferase
MSRILVIRLGALGDLVLSFPAFAAIRAHHARDHITLLTTSPFVALAAASPWFDDVKTDTRPGWLDLPRLWRLRQCLRGFDFVYDLQTSRRSSRYFRLAGRPPWCGIAPGCSHPDTNPERDTVHSIDRQRRQLAAAGVPPAVTDLSWLAGHGPCLEGRIALLIPATSGTHGGAKTWPADRYAALARRIAARGMTPTVIGTKAETGAAVIIRDACPETLDLTGRTNILDLAGLTHKAALAVGGDTGPVHLAAMMGAPTIALFSRFSDPIHARPVGQTTLLRADDILDLSVERVAAALP